MTTDTRSSDDRTGLAWWEQLEARLTKNVAAYEAGGPEIPDREEVLAELRATLDVVRDALRSAAERSR